MHQFPYHCLSKTSVNAFMEATPRQQKVPVYIEDEMRQSFMDYAMSVIISRALPDVRDGLKPVHRRVLYAMYEMSLTHEKRYRKSAGVVGEVLKSYQDRKSTRLN